MNIVKTKIAALLQSEIQKLYWIELSEIKLDTPPKKELGDFCFGPFLLAKPTGKNPALISNELKNALENNPNFLELSVAGPYLNFKLSYKFYSDIFLNESQSIPQVWAWKTIVVDYIGANVGKPLHIGHMCTPNQGQVTCNLYRLLGYQVIGDSHIWDWGIIFWKLILAYKMWWDESKLKENAVNHLFDLYVKVTAETEKDETLEEQTRAEFKKLSQWDADSIKLWQSFTSYSISAMQVQLNRLNVKPDFDIGESFYEGIGLPKMGNYPDLQFKMSDIVKELIEKKVAIKNEDGSVWVTFDETTKIPSCMLAKRDGTHGYLASDLAAIKYRVSNWNPSRIIYHVDSRQELHFKQAFEIAKNAGWSTTTETFFAWNGFIRLKDGAMSTRKGNIIKLDDLLDEAVQRAKNIILEKNPEASEKDLLEISEIIGIGAIKYWYLSKSRTTDMIFDWDEFMTFEWNSFPYVAYSYVRALRVLEKSQTTLETIKNTQISSTFSQSEQINLFKEITALNETLIWVHDAILPHNLVGYVYNLSKNFSAFYNAINILSEENQEKKLLNLKLIVSYTQTLELVFNILAIKLPTKM